VTLCDTGPLVALIDSGDRNHARCVQSLSSLPPSPLITTWPCLTEAMYLLHRAAGIRAQNELWAFITVGLVHLHLPNAGEWRRIQEVMNQYADMPLDMADASLISAAEQLRQTRLFSLDSRLRAVRIGVNAVFDVIP
jgi:uncharacterized protein